MQFLYILFSKQLHHKGLGFYVIVSLISKEVSLFYYHRFHHNFINSEKGKLEGN